MTSRRLASVGIPIPGLALAGVLLARPEARAQGVPVPGLAPAPTGPGSALVLPLVALGLVVAAALVLTFVLLDRRRRRQARAIAMETDLSDRLMQEPRLASARVTAVVRLPWSAAGAPVIEIRGEVPYPELRDLAVRLARQEGLRYHPDATVEDRVFVAPPIGTRAS